MSIDNLTVSNPDVEKEVPNKTSGIYSSCGSCSLSQCYPNREYDEGKIEVIEQRLLVLGVPLQGRTGRPLFGARNWRITSKYIIFILSMVCLLFVETNRAASCFSERQACSISQSSYQHSKDLRKTFHCTKGKRSDGSRPMFKVSQWVATTESMERCLLGAWIDAMASCEGLCTSMLSDCRYLYPTDSDLQGLRLNATVIPKGGFAELVRRRLCRLGTRRLSGWGRCGAGGEAGERFKCRVWSDTRHNQVKERI